MYFDNIVLFNFICGSLHDNDNCSWQLERGRESDLSQSGETREPGEQNRAETVYFYVRIRLIAAMDSRKTMVKFLASYW